MVAPDGFVRPFEDFSTLIQRQEVGAGAGHAAFPSQPAAAAPCWHQIESTTILAFKYSGGVLVAGDRRATAGHTIMHDRAEKVLQIDTHSVMAIAGVPGTAWEMARMLDHSFQYFRRSQLQELSVEGKVRALSKLLRDNLGLVLQGVGAVAPIFATHHNGTGRVYFYDAMGARFEVTDFAASGSGGAAVRSVFHYASRWGGRPLGRLSRDEAVGLALRALETAALSDTATGGVDRRSGIFPVMKIIGDAGIADVSTEELKHRFHEEAGGEAGS